MPEKNRYHERLFTELRLAVYDDSRKVPLSDVGLQKALTLNENLKSLGYTLKPADIVRLAGSPSLDTLYDELDSYVGKVEAEPMYRGYPKEVMEMDEAVFRFHQMLHYMSTYGVEMITGTEVKKGWMPESEEIERTEDKALLDAKVLDLVPASRQYIEPARALLGKASLLTPIESEIASYALTNLEEDQIRSLDIPFKKNMMGLFSQVLMEEDRTAAERTLRGLCQHTGDVLKCTDYALTQRDYHFRKTDKKLLSRLIESYPAADFRENLCLSEKKADRAKLVLNYVGYGTHGRSPEHLAQFHALRSGELTSWLNKAQVLIMYHDPDAVSFIAMRPGMLVRDTAWLIREGYSPEEITAALVKNADKLSTQTLAKTLQALSDKISEHVDVLKKTPGIGFGEKDKDIFKLEEMIKTAAVLKTVLSENLSLKETLFTGRKVFLDVNENALRASDFSYSVSDKGGYGSAVSVNIPDSVKYLRFFVYWDSENRVDVDLHASAFRKNGERVAMGWDADYRNKDCFFSGDITVSDAAEYIDIKLPEKGSRDEHDIASVSMNIDVYSIYGREEMFSNIDKCFAGVMGVGEMGEKVMLYDPKNCFFSRDLTEFDMKNMDFAAFDTVHRVMKLSMKESDRGYDARPPRILNEDSLTSYDYVTMLLLSQGCELVDTPEEADVVITDAKSTDERAVSLIDSNFMMDAPETGPKDPGRAERAGERYRSEVDVLAGTFGAYGMMMYAKGIHEKAKAAVRSAVPGKGNAVKPEEVIKKAARTVIHGAR